MAERGEGSRSYEGIVPGNKETQDGSRAKPVAASADFLPPKALALEDRHLLQLCLLNSSIPQAVDTHSSPLSPLTSMLPFPLRLYSPRQSLALAPVVTTESSIQTASYALLILI